MKGILQDLMRPTAKRIGSQLAALMVGFGMDHQHEVAVAAAITWAVLFAVELLLDKKERERQLDKRSE